MSDALNENICFVWNFCKFQYTTEFHISAYFSATSRTSSIGLHRISALVTEFCIKSTLALQLGQVAVEVNRSFHND